MFHQDVVFSKLARWSGVLLAGILCTAPGNRVLAQDAAGAAPSAWTPQTLHSNSSLVALDVVVDDANGNFLSGLQGADFQIKEDGQPQKVFYVETHTRPSVAMADVTLRSPNTFNDYGDKGGTSSAIILMLDALDSPDLLSQLYLRQQLIAYMREVPRGTQIAIVQMDSSLHLLQGFTGDPEELLRTVNGVHNTIRLSPLPSDPCAATGGGRQPGSVGSSPNADGTVIACIHDPMYAFAMAHGYGQVADDERNSVLKRALPELMDVANSVPGRKSVVWFYSKSPAGEAKASAAKAMFSADERAIAESMHHVMDVFRPSNISITFVDTSSHFNLSVDNAMLASFAQKNGDEAFYNTNGIRQVLEHVADNAWNYYTVYYSPSNREFDGHYRSISLEIEHAHGLLQYRRGYFAERELGSPAEGNGRRRLPKILDPVEASRTELDKAMVLGNKPPTDVLFEVHIDEPKKGASQASQKDVKSFVAERFKGEKAKPYLLDYTVNARSINFQQDSPGHFVGHAVLAVVAYSDAGDVVSTLRTSITIKADPAVLQQLMEVGVPVTQTILVPEKSSRFLRVGVQDSATGKAGALEVPLDDVTATRTASR